MSSFFKSLRIVLLLMATMITLGVSAQNVTVKGTVTDKTGETVIGATVVEKGKTSNGSTTDFDGNYKVSVPTNATLVISYVGMKTKEVAVKGQTTINVVLEDDAKMLEEVVAVGYGTMKKKDLTGAIATVNSEALVAVPVANAAEALTGKMAGVQIFTTEGNPDADVKIRVRGGGSITQSNEPLYIVDGFPVESISDIPASDIEDITVLKDASSTAIYGSRGANGVILVTTKSGQEGKTKVSFNAYYSLKKRADKFKVLKPYDYAKWQYELALLHAQGDLDKISSYTDYFGNYRDMDLYQDCEYNDWQDIVNGRTGETYNTNVNITGGTDALKYAFSYAFIKDKGIQVGSDFRRHNFSLKLNTKPFKNTTLDLQARYNDTNVLGAGSNEAAGVYDTDRRLKYSVIYTPIPLANLNSSAGAADDDLGNLYNPLESQRDNDQKKHRKNLNVAAAFGWEIFKNFKAKAEIGYDDYNNYGQRFWGPTSYYVKNVPAAEYQNMPATRSINTTRNRIRSTNTINYDFKGIFGKSSAHKLNLLAGHEYVFTSQNDITNEVHGFPAGFDSETAWKLSSAGNYPFTIDDNYKANDKLLSYFGRANYSFMDKYLFSATFRADASSKFAAGNKWGYFPSAALAWRISSEKFMEGSQEWLDDLKLRVSYGTAGNNGIPTGQLIQSYNSSNTTWVNGLTGYVAPSKVMANPNLKWETTITRNIGLDFSFLNGKLSGTAEVYLNSTKDLLLSFPVAGTGYDTQYRNIGSTQNKGFELTLNAHPINTKNFALDINANIGFNKNKVTSLGGLESYGWNSRWASTEIGQDYWLEEGQPLGRIRGFQSAGRYEVSDFVGYDEAKKQWTLKEGVVNASNYVGTIRPGSMKLVDQNGDGVITDEDNTIIGNVNPTCTGGFGLSARIYGFDLTANFNYSIGNKLYNANKIEYTQTGKYQYRNMIDIMEDGKRWTNLNADGTLCNDPAQLAAMNANTTMWSPWTKQMILTDWAIEDASFLRLNTLSLGYSLPKSAISKINATQVRFYVTCYNVFTITKYSGLDPESDCIRGTGLTPCVDYSGYPKSRQFVFGLNLNF